MKKSTLWSFLRQYDNGYYCWLAGLIMVFLCIGSLQAAEDDPRLKEPLEVLADKPEAPDFTLKTFDGGTFTLSEQRGKWVFVHFWSIYCPHCTREISTLAQLNEAYRAVQEKGELKGTMEWVAVNFGEDEEKILEWAKAHDRDLSGAKHTHILLDEDKSVTRSWRIFGLPSSFVVNPEGRIELRAIGERNWTTPAIRAQFRERLR